ncbi:hypothetical protein Salat_0982800 [Sesamum alatum]|uniref:Uncharacterized protein n=1 Tax=Sesamum alatum TaxID=300844 RepID=A0AAE1YLF0_9LAMI|nr:hypothetical protein Salat_0982800 [Sesamum alatum]
MTKLQERRRNASAIISSFFSSDHTYHGSTITTKKLTDNVNQLLQKNIPKATAATEANTAGTKLVASDAVLGAGDGAGASCAATFGTAETIKATTTATKRIFIFKASISNRVG